MTLGKFVKAVKGTSLPFFQIYIQKGLFSLVLGIRNDVSFVTTRFYWGSGFPTVAAIVIILLQWRVQESIRGSHVIIILKKNALR